jgi:membrane fusion protein (multidrug efflux system)
MEGVMGIGKALRGILMGGVPLVAVVLGGQYYAENLRYVTTENAYVRAPVITISAEIDGRVAFVNAKENAWVEQGESLLGIDARPLAAARAAAEADLASARLGVTALRARYREGLAEIDSAAERVRFLEAEFARLSGLAATGNFPKAQVDAASHDLALAKRRLATLRETNGIVLAELGGALDGPVDSHPLVKRAEADVEARRIALEQARFHAPVSGHVGQVDVQPGEYVEAGDALFALVDTKDFWVQANLKEVQLAHVRVGQSVRVVVDGYPDLAWTGVIEGISPATGSEFALLPPQNASGNWVKVVQRVPVRVRLDPNGRENLLRAGMTAHVSIDTERDRSLIDVVKSVVAGTSTTSP